MKVFRILGVSLIAAAASMSVMTATAVTSTASAQSLSDVLAAARAERQAVREENQRREEAFKAERNQQAAKLSQIRGQVRRAEAESDRLEAEYEVNAIEIGRLNDELDARQAEFKELFGAARTAAEDFSGAISNSIISAQYPGRVSALKKLASSDRLPSILQLEGLWFTMLQEMTEQAAVTKFEGTIYADNGTLETVNVTRIGPFTAFSDGKFLIYNSDTQSLKQLAKQPGATANVKPVEAAKRVENYTGDGFVQGMIDPSLGTLLALSVDSPTIKDIIDQGGPIGKIIIGLAILGILLGVYKMFALWGVGSAVRGQMRKKNASKGNPLGRILNAYHSNTSADTDTLALKLDDAILKEVPKLENGLNLIKVAAAVAPLLGLLGTVTGMIKTFESIKLFGAGDPKLMAGGISEALVTTELGLIAAIPLLILHAFAAGSARSISQILEEQSAGMIAEHAESSK
jgi:biopolymer transport protein ExbB